MTLFGFGKKKEKEINAPVCTCNGNCSVSETVEPENLNNCCQDIQGRICCIKVLGSGCASCHALYENTQSAVKAMGISVEVEYMAISTRQVKNKRDSNGVLTGRPGTVYDVNIKYTAPNGEKKTYSKKGFPTKKEATQHEAEMKAKLHNPGQIASIASQRKQTVASYLNEWVESYARVNLRPSTYDGYKRTIANYITPYIGGVALNQLTPAMVDKMFQQIIDKGLKPSTAAGAKRVLSVALSHARKYRYIETNAAKDTLTKFGKSDKTPDPYTPEQVKALMQRVEGTVWEMPVILGGLYGMRRSEILGLRWRNVDLENNTFDVSEQLPFKVPPKTKVIEEMAPPKSNGRKLPITELARPFFLKQFAMQEAQREQAEKDGKPYYDNDLVVAKPDGSPISASWVSSQFGKLLEDLDMPHIRFHDLRHPYVKHTTKNIILKSRKPKLPRLWI